MAEEQKKITNQLDTQTDKLVKTIGDIYKNVPHLPENIREVLVKIAPILSLIFGVLGILVGLGQIGASPIALLGGVGNSFTVLISGILAIVSSVLLLLAYPKLKSREFQGWKYLFWAELVNFGSSVVNLLNTSSAYWIGSVFGILLGAAIGFYILFELRSYYK